MLDYPPSYDAPTTFVEAVRAQNSAQVLHFTKSGTGSAPISFDVWQKRGSDVVNYRSYKGYAPFFYALKPVFVGPVTAAAILAWRTANGAFTSVDQLTEVDGIRDAIAWLPRRKELLGY